MKDDLSGRPKPTLTPSDIEIPAPTKSLAEEGKFEAPKKNDELPKITPLSPSSPARSTAPPAPLDYHSKFPPEPKIKEKPPILIVPPKTIPPKGFPELPVKPLYKASPVWIKFGIIGLAVAFLVFAGLYSYWKFFIREELPWAPEVSPTATPALPIIPTATTTPTATPAAPIKFFNKLPHKSITIDLPEKTSNALMQALKSEAKIEEARASVKQLKITYQGNPLKTEEFFNLMPITAPKDFLLNYENEFALAFFNQKEGAQSILILQAKNKDLAKTQIGNWEKSTLPNDILPLFLSNFNLPKPLSSFKTYLFIGQPVSYLNIGVAFTSLNYTIYNNFLVFTTSSAGMFVVLQDLTGQGVSFDYQKSLEASINNFVK